MLRADHSYRGVLPIVVCLSMWRNVFPLNTMCRERYPKVAPLIDSLMFMEDVVVGVDDGNEAISIYYELTALMKTINP